MVRVSVRVRVGIKLGLGLVGIRDRLRIGFRVSSGLGFRDSFMV
jgi:hypothetical protein